MKRSIVVLTLLFLLVASIASAKWNKNMGVTVNSQYGILDGQASNVSITLDEYLYPGFTTSTTFDITNTGDIPFNLTATTSGVPADFTVNLSGTPVQVAVGATVTITVDIEISESLPDTVQGDSPSFSIDLGIETL